MKKLQRVEKMLREDTAGTFIVTDEHPEPCEVCGMKFCKCPMTEEEKAKVAPKGTY